MRRALVLGGVHLVIAAHITHFLVRGRTVSPVEPSETMYTLELGQINAGFILLCVTLVGTLVFGRFFCGWGCHLVALQDLCGWAMKKLGVRPRPFRSRLLLYAPLAVALYMFAWPTVRRWLSGGPPLPEFHNHLMTTGFWQTFPGPFFTVLTFLVCGFAAVYFLGSKGFCTYGCPYGALFGFADRFSPGRIVVSDACEQCGHCSATCTSNVVVHEEVRLYGQVVDPGCMKCMDCVSVCPNGALSFGFSRPAVLARRPPAGERPSARYPLSAAQEFLLAGVCLAATLALRGLYDGPPLLLSVAAGGITAFLVLRLWQLLRRPGLRLQNLVLKQNGRWRTAGRWFAALAALWLLFVIHSGFVQWHRAWGRHHLARTEATRAEVMSGAFRHREYSPGHHHAVARAARHFSLSDRWGLRGVAEVKLGLAWTHLLRDEPQAAENRIRAALALTPDARAQHDNLIDLLERRGNATEAVTALKEKIARFGRTERDAFRLGTSLASLERLDEAAVELAACVDLAPERADARYNLGGVLRRLGRHEDAIEHLRVATRLLPDDFDAHVELGLAEKDAGLHARARRSLRRAVELAPERPEALHYLPRLIEELEQRPADGR